MCFVPRLEIAKEKELKYFDTIYQYKIILIVNFLQDIPKAIFITPSLGSSPAVLIVKFFFLNPNKNLKIDNKFYSIKIACSPSCAKKPIDSLVNCSKSVIYIQHFEL